MAKMIAQHAMLHFIQSHYLITIVRGISNLGDSRKNILFLIDAFLMPPQGKL